MIGADPTWLGWMTCAAMLIASVLAVRAALGAPAQRRFWLIIALLMVLLGLNKQLDLQTTMIEYAKSLAQAQGWYEDRAVVQRGFLIVLAGVTMIAGIVIGRMAVRGGHNTRLAGIGVLLLFLFILFRAVVIGRQDDGLPGIVRSDVVGRALEITGVLVVCIAAWRSRSTQPRKAGFE
ncbi:MAG: hypothetical protein AAF432_16300 [Planctomycetota bacterium]